MKRFQKFKKSIKKNKVNKTYLSIKIIPPLPYFIKFFFYFYFIDIKFLTRINFYMFCFCNNKDLILMKMNNLGNFRLQFKLDC